MSHFKIHNIQTAPEGSKAQLEESLQSFGFLPSLHGAFAESPQALEAYKTLHQLFQRTSFNKEELTVVWQTISVEHNCHYCVPAHSMIADMMKVDTAITTALRNRTALPTQKLQVLHETTLILVRNRGHITSEELERFFAEGYQEQQVLEIILGIAQKVMSNYTNHLANTPLDPPMVSYKWEVDNVSV